MIIELHAKKCGCGGTGFIKLPSGVRATCNPAYIMRLPVTRWEELGKPTTIEDANEAIRKAKEEKDEQE